MISCTCFDPAIDFGLSDYDTMTDSEKKECARKVKEKSKSYSKHFNEDMSSFVEEARDAVIDVLNSDSHVRCFEKPPTCDIRTCYDEFDERGYEYVVFYDIVRQMRLEKDNDDCICYTTIYIYSKEHRGRASKLMIEAHTSYDEEYMPFSNGNPIVNSLSMYMNFDNDRFDSDETFFEELGELGDSLAGYLPEILRKVPEKHGYSVIDQESKHSNWLDAIYGLPLH